MEDSFRVGEWRVEPRRNRIVGPRGERKLAPRVVRLLTCLAKQAGETISRDELAERVWESAFISDEVLTQSVYELRKALGDDPKDARFIQTVPTRGYRLVAPVETSGSVSEEHSAHSDDSVDGSSPEPARRNGASHNARIAMAFLAVAGVAAVLAWVARQPDVDVDEARPVSRLALPLPEGTLLAVNVERQSLRLSPDGRQAAFVARSGDTARLYLRSLDLLDAVAVDAGDGAEMPVFSPDSQWLAFLVGERLMKVSVRGGGAVRVSTLDRFAKGATWTENGGIIVSPFTNLGLHRVSVEGGEHSVLTAPERDRREKAHRHPRALPGRPSVLFTLVSADIDSYDDAAVAVASLENGAYRVLVQGGTSAEYSPSGHLVFAREGDLFAVPFDLDTLSVEGTPVRVLEGVAMSLAGGTAEFSLSRDGSLLYAAGPARGTGSRVVSVDRAGSTETILGTPGRWQHPRVSPDGGSLAIRNMQANSSVWIYDLRRNAMERLAFGYDNGFPAWKPDGRHLAFSSNRAGNYNLYLTETGSTAAPTRLSASEHLQGFSSWSPDGNVIVWNERRPDTGFDLWTLSFSLEEKRSAVPFLQTAFNEEQPAFSPGGGWIAYHSDETGHNEVYIRPYPPSSRVIKVSSGGATVPVWRPDGKELFYRDGNRLMAVDVVGSNEDLVLGPPSTILEPRVPRQAPFSVNELDFDITPDGERFVFVEDSGDELAITELIFVHNWAEELKRLVPIED